MRIIKFSICMLMLIFFGINSWGQYYNDPNAPHLRSLFHTNAKIRTYVSNWGMISGISYPGYATISGDSYGSITELWIGGIVDGDTLVSTSDVIATNGILEFWPDFPPSGYPDDLSLPLQPNQSLYEIPLQFFRAEYTDTATKSSFVGQDPFELRSHRPLGLKVIQSSRSFHNTLAEDFILVDYLLQNIGTSSIDSMYVGLLHNGLTLSRNYPSTLPPPPTDVCGFLDSTIHEYPELGFEQIDAAWCADVNGRPNNNNFGLSAERHIFAIAPVGLPDGARNSSFNWWIIDSIDSDYRAFSGWGPRQWGTYTDPVRLFHNRQFGIAFTDCEKYYLMAHEEFDYTSYYAALDLGRQGWMQGYDKPEELTDGHPVEFLTSFGPFSLEPNEGKRVTIAFVIGENFHTNPAAYSDLFTPDYPFDFMRTLDQSDLVTNIRWARKLYDNPGVDTDQDGDSGKYVYRYDKEYGDSLKVYYEGDGVPDFQPVHPPEPPPIRILSENNKIILRWNGRGVEEAFDHFSGIRDFEGYRVYIGRSELPEEVQILTSFDKINFNRHVWNARYRKYEIVGLPLTLDSIYTAFGEGFDYDAYSELYPYIDNQNRKIYFTPVGFNQNTFGDAYGIRKMYPDATKDTLDVDEEGRMRYYEYECVIDNLLMTIPYYVSLSVMDFGYPGKYLEGAESDPMKNLQKAYAVYNDWNRPDTQKMTLGAYVFPNPYFSDGRYKVDGFENRLTDLIPDKARSIYFANIPAVCDISIYTLDGDLVRKLHHEKSETSGDAHIARWDMINRNNMTISFGLYYFVIESSEGNQVGKFAVIR